MRDGDTRPPRERAGRTGIGTPTSRKYHNSGAPRKTPNDLTAGRDRGLTREVCAHCGADTNERPIHHDKHCRQPVAGRFERQRQRASLPKRFGAAPDWRFA